MFTGIIESTGIVKNVLNKKNNVVLTIKADFSSELYIKQSIAINGICLTVEKKNNDSFEVTAIEETIQKTHLAFIKKLDRVNLERALKLNDRIDGHIVQGHVDKTTICENIKLKNGSWEFTFKKEPNDDLLIKKGSITINGVSLTIASLTTHSFSVAIIPYTFSNTTFENLKKGDCVNIEFDILGKYLKKLNFTN